MSLSRVKAEAKKKTVPQAISECDDETILREIVGFSTHLIGCGF